MTSEIRNLEPRQAIGIDHRGPYTDIGEKFGVLAAFQASHPASYGAAFAEFYDDTNTTSAEDLRSLAGMFVDGAPPAVEEPLRVVEAGGGEYLVHVHRGSYAGLADAWKAHMNGPLPAGYRLRDAPPMEIYVSMSMDDGGESSLTELLAPIERE